MRFQKGLKIWIRSRVAVFESNTYYVVVRKAMIIESESEQGQREHEGRKRKFEQQRGSQTQGNVQGHLNKRLGFQNNQVGGFMRQGTGNQGPANQFPINIQQRMIRPPLQDCRICGRNYLGQCGKMNVTCFKCNQKGHYAKECRNPAMCGKYGKLGHMTKDCRAPATESNALRIAGPTTPNQPRARAFNMNISEAVDDTEVVAGMLLINSKHANILFDSGATKSFISEDFMKSLNCETQLLDKSLMIELANQDKVPVHEVCPQCNIEISCQILVPK